MTADNATVCEAAAALWYASIAIVPCDDCPGDDGVPPVLALSRDHLRRLQEDMIVSITRTIGRTCDAVDAPQRRELCKLGALEARARLRQPLRLPLPPPDTLVYPRDWTMSSPSIVQAWCWLHRCAETFAVLVSKIRAARLYAGNRGVFCVQPAHRGRDRRQGGSRRRDVRVGRTG